MKCVNDEAVHDSDAVRNGNAVHFHEGVQDLHAHQPQSREMTHPSSSSSSEKKSGKKKRAKEAIGQEEERALILVHGFKIQSSLPCPPYSSSVNVNERVTDVSRWL
jgi:hypothetical protein